MPDICWRKKPYQFNYTIQSNDYPTNDGPVQGFFRRIGKIVDDGNLVAVVEQLKTGVTADIASSAGTTLLLR